MAKSTKPKTPKGFTCGNCGAEHVFPAYVYAHWDMTLNHSCPCGARHDIIGGTATMVRVERKKLNGSR